MTSVLDWLLSSGKNVSYFVQIERENVKSAHIDEFNKQTKQKKKEKKHNINKKFDSGAKSSQGQVFLISDVPKWTIRWYWYLQTNRQS